MSKKIIPQQELVLEQGSEGYSCYCYQHIPILYNSKKAFSINTNRFRWKAGKIKRMIKTKKLGVNFKLSVGANDSLVAVFYFANNGNKEERLLHMSMYTTVGVPLLVDYAMKEDQKGLKKTTSVFFNGELDHRKNVFYALCADNIGEDLDERYIIQKYGLIY